MDINTLHKIKELAQRLFNGAAELLALFSQTEREERRLLEEWQNSDDRVLQFPSIKEKTKNPAEAQFYSKEEIEKMPKLKDGRFRITKDGLHQVRYRRNGYDVQFTSKDLKTVKARFREWVKEQNLREQCALAMPKPSKKVTLAEFAEQYFEYVKKPNVQDATFKALYATFERHVVGKIGMLPLNEISPLTCQRLLNGILEAGKGRTAEQLKVTLKEIFRGAVGEKLITDNPMAYVKIPRHVQENGTALSLAELKAFVSAAETSYYFKPFMVLLFTGVRRGELASATFDDDLRFMTVANGKTHKGTRQTYRKIPICDELRPFLPLTERQIHAFGKKMTVEFKKYCPNHHLYDLRHTFTTRCMECGVAKAVVDVWTGHVNRSDMTTSVYTHFSDEFMLKEVKKLSFLHENG